MLASESIKPVVSEFPTVDIKVAPPPASPPVNAPIKALPILPVEKNNVILRAPNIPDIKLGSKINATVLKTDSEVKVQAPNLEVNLIPNNAMLEQANKGFSSLVWAGVISLVLVGLVFVGLVRYKNMRTTQNEAAQNILIDLQQQIENSSQVIETAGGLTKRINKISQLLQTRPSLLPLFDWLEANTLPAVFFTNLTADETGQVALVGEAPGLTDMAKQMKAFTESPQVAKFDLGGFQFGGSKEESTPPSRGATASVGNVTFTFNIKLKPEVFLPAAQ